MKKIIIFLMALLCCSTYAFAVPAKQAWQTITQSDGTTLQIHVVGNAFSHAILTRDGLMVARGADGDFYYQSSLTGMTTVRAHEANQRASVEKAFINAQRSNLTFNSKPASHLKKDAPSRVGGSNADSSVPALGQRKIPIILVEFKDKAFNNTREDIINAMLMGSSSVGQYFRDQSNGLYEPDFEVYGIYTLSHNREYYGGHSGDNNDKGLGYMVTEACQMAAADGVSFAPYDTNNDYYCDVVIVIYAGVGEAQAWSEHPEAIWPCNWDLYSAFLSGQGGNGPFHPSNGDPLVNTFAVFNELNGSNDNATTIDGIGTFAHEFGHCLGLPDFYDTGDGDYYGMGSWDIMCLGCYGNNGYTPVGYSAYEKVFMGWINYVTPQPGTYYTLPVMNQKSTATDKALCLTSPLNANEYFIIENRKKQGWDRYIPGEGIMITHVTYDADRWWYNSPNNEAIQLMTLMNADNNWSLYNERYDLWPQGNKKDFTDDSTPAAKLNMTANGSITGNAGFLGKPVTEMVINQDGTASFWFMKGSATGPVISVSTENLDFGGVMMNNSASKTFIVTGQALTGDVTLTLNDPDGVFSLTPTVISPANAANMETVTVTFTPGAIQDYNASVTLSTDGGEDVTVALTAHGLIEGYVPELLPAANSGIGLTQFRAEWTDQTPAANIASYTLEVSTKKNVELLDSADFSDVPDAITPDGYLEEISGNFANFLPDGWACTPYIYAYGGALLAGSNGMILTATYDLTGYDKVSVVLDICSYYYDYYGEATGQVKTSKGLQPITVGADFEPMTIVLDCASSDRIIIQSGENFLYLRSVKVYAGDLTQDQRNATESGDDTYRLITGITDKFYTVCDLSAGGSFNYMVKAIYTDGTESSWSKRQSVTLFDNVDVPGDVNGDGDVNIGDINKLISIILGGQDDTDGRADVNNDTEVNIGDINAVIDIILH